MILIVLAVFKIPMNFFYDRGYGVVFSICNSCTELIKLCLKDSNRIRFFIDMICNYEYIQGLEKHYRRHLSIRCTHPIRQKEIKFLCYRFFLDKEIDAFMRDSPEHNSVYMVFFLFNYSRKVLLNELDLLDKS